jgi:hypothetical protein
MLKVVPIVTDNTATQVGKGCEKAVNILIFAIGFVVAGLVVFALWPRRRGRWGINLTSVKCPKCGTEQPRFRKPENWHQGMWGGYTCGTCEQEMDKYGNALV